MSKVSIAASGLLAKILCIAGAIIGIPFVIVTFAGFAIVDFKDMFPSFFIFFAIDIACAALVVAGIKIERRIRRFKTYVHIIAKNQKTALRNLAKETGRDIAFVTTDIRSMIKLKYFANAYIDEDSQEIIVQHMLGDVDMTDITSEIVECKNCGAETKKQKSTLSYCEYCGSPIA